MKMKVIYLFMLSLLLYAGGLKANETVTSDTTKTELILPVLDTLFIWAETNSPILKGQDALIEKTTEDQKRIKKIILDVFKVYSNVQNGNYGNPIVNQLQTGYSTGASLQFSLYQIFGYKNQVKIYGAECKVAKFKRDELLMDLRKVITILYNNVETQKAILKIRSEATFAAFTHMKMAEKEFSENSVAVSELSRVTEIYTKTQVDYEVTFNELKNNYMQLEQLIGKPLN